MKKEVICLFGWGKEKRKYNGIIKKIKHFRQGAVYKVVCDLFPEGIWLTENNFNYR